MTQSAFVTNWLRDRLGQDIRNAAAPVVGTAAEQVKLEFSVAPVKVASPAAVVQTPQTVLDECDRPALVLDTTQSPAAAPFTPPVHKQYTQGTLPVPLVELPRWRYGFTDFVVGASNNVAYAAARDVCRPSPAVDTLFVSAAPGLGKTHLVHAVGQYLCDEQKKMHVGYLTAEEFTSCFVTASRTRQMDAFKAQLRLLDVLLLEDVHFFQGKEKTQEEVLATIKSLQSRGSRIILTSSFTPRELKHIDSQLVSYFSSGMLTVMQKPTHEMRCQILEHKAKSHQVLLPSSVTELLADRLTADVRQLESCLNSLVFKARYLNKQISLELALDVLGQYAVVEPVLTMERIVALVCQSYGLTEQQLVSRSRRHECVQARNAIFYLARKHTELSLQEIGEKFNRRHSTVINGITSLEREVQRNSVLGRQTSNTLKLIEKNAGIVQISV